MSSIPMVSDHSIKSVGVISDTHGLVRDTALGVLKGCDIIIHAGDIGSPAVLERLRELAPVYAVRGNNDRGDWASTLPLTEVIQLDRHFVYLLHDLHELDVDPVAAGFAAVITGHSHKPSTATRDGVLYLNPGSAGPRRFKLPISVARLDVDGSGLNPRIIELDA
jgi:uncharacterized protein